MMQQSSTVGFVLALVCSSTISGLAQDQTTGFAAAEQEDRLVISHGGEPVASFVFRDEKTLRPYFANVHAPGGVQVTRNFPPIDGVDATDHDTIHPGIWLGFGDISGSDFWRNKSPVKHVRFSKPPVANGDRLTFATESQLWTQDDQPLCQLTCHFQLANRPLGWLLVWEAAFHSDDSDFTFGDQEEMGFGARMATTLTEKSGGLIVNSHGQRTAENTWGQPALWCDYSKSVAGHSSGITLMAAPSNFRESWWHNRDYGVFVANPFGRHAMKQGEPSVVTVKRGETFRLKFAAFLHDSIDYDPASAYSDFMNLNR